MPFHPVELGSRAVVNAGNIGITVNTELVMSQYRKTNSFSVFGPNLRALRGESSQAEFAKLLGLANQVTYHRYENGRVPRAEVLQQIADRVGLTVNDLLSPLSPETIDAFQNRGTIESSKSGDPMIDACAPMYRAVGELVNDVNVKRLQAAFDLGRASDEELLSFYEHIAKAQSRAPFEHIKYYSLIVVSVQRELARRLRIKK